MSIPGSKRLEEPESMLERAIERADRECVIGDEFTAGPEHCGRLIDKKSSGMAAASFDLSSPDSSTARIPRPFTSVSSNSASGSESATIAAAHLKAGAIAFNQDRPDRDVECARSAAAEVADRTGVEAAPVRLELVDDLHGADLGGTGDRAAGKDGANHVDRPGAGPDSPFDRGDQMMDLGKRFDLHRVEDHDRAVLADATQVVALQVDDHRQLGAVFGRIPQLVGEPRVLVGIAAARPGPFDRPRDHPVAPRLVKPLRACRDDGQVVPVQKRRERRRAGRFEPQVEVEWLSGCRAP